MLYCGFRACQSFHRAALGTLMRINATQHQWRQRIAPDCPGQQHSGVVVSNTCTSTSPRMSGSKPNPRHLEVCVDEMARHSAGKKVARGSVFTVGTKTTSQEPGACHCRNDNFCLKADEVVPCEMLLQRFQSWHKSKPIVGATCKIPDPYVQRCYHQRHHQHRQ